MKRLILSGLFLALAGASTAFAINYREPTPHIEDIGCQIVDASELTEDILEEIVSGKFPEIILECAEGTTCPFKLSLKGEFLAFKEDDPLRTIEVLKTCFIKCDGETLFFSTDLQNWKDFQEFFTGIIGVRLDIEEEIPTVCFNIELNQRA